MLVYHDGIGTWSVYPTLHLRSIELTTLCSIDMKIVMAEAGGV